MALVLKLRPGDDVLIHEEGQPDYQLTVTRIFGPHSFEIRTATGEHAVVVDDRSIEAVPNVYLQAGKEGTLRVACLVIDAPRRIRIIKRQHRRLTHGVS